MVLAAVGLAQGAALAVAWKNYPGMAPAAPRPVPVTKTALPADVQSPAVPEAPPTAAGPVSVAELAVEAGEGDRSLDAEALKNAGMDSENTPVMARPVVKTAYLNVPITDENCLRHLDEGIFLRDRGDMQGAMRELRAALSVMPEHPQLLYQTARTLDMMIQERKALVFWDQLRKLGPDAGNFYEMAVARMKELNGLPVEPVANEEEKEGRFALGKVTAERLAGTVNGEILRFQASVIRRQTEPVEVTKIWMKLHLFDIVNGQHIDRTTAVQPDVHWRDETEQKVDWNEGTEDFSFEYRQPPLTPDDIVKMGQRKYYGYAVELRYGEEKSEKFQDMVADPKDLAEFARDLPEDLSPAGAGTPDAPAFGPAGQPEGTLFPGDRF